MLRRLRITLVMPSQNKKFFIMEKEKTAIAIRFKR